jgi:branched-chain amino acid transport system permease protein
MDRFFEALFIGLSSGAIYSLVALGIVVVFRGSGHLNFAQGEMATLSAYVASVAAAWTLPIVHWDVPMWGAAIVAMVFGFLVSAATEILIVRPLGKRSPLAVFVALIAVFLGINALDAGLWGAPPSEVVTSLFPNAPTDFAEVFGTVWRYKDIGTLVVTIVITALLFLLFAKTKIGLAMRAVASNTESGKLVGIPTGLVLAGSWGLAGALAAVAGTMFAGAQGNPGQVTPILMFTVFVYASAAATLGGLDSPIGAVVAGLSIGVVENQAAEWAPGWIGQEMKLSVALACIFVVLLVRPSGLFGTVKVERV